MTECYSGAAELVASLERALMIADEAGDTHLAIHVETALELARRRLGAAESGKRHAE